ncbi:MAG: hypothetical protein V7739_20790 [Motiliproteus sp.]
MMYYSFESIVERIVTLNKAWKIAQEDFGAESMLAKSLRDQKSSWQATLLREFSEKVSIKVDTENSTAVDVLLSVRLKHPVHLSDGTVKNDAEHLPLRIAKDILHEHEIQSLIAKHT